MSKLDLVPLSDKLFLVNAPNEGRFPLSHSFLIRGEKTVLIDTGCGLDVCRALMEEFPIEAVYNSHAHPDHIAGNFLFRGIDIFTPDVRSMETGTLDILATRLVGPDPKVMDFWKTFVRQFTGIEDYEATGTFSDGDILDFGGITLQAIHTPGHLEDHFCFWEPENKILMSFDIDLTGFGPFCGNPESDIQAFMESLDKVMALKPAVAASSHRPPIFKNAGRALQAFQDKFARNDQSILETLDAPKTLEEILALKPIYKKYFPGGEVLYRFFERNMISKHLARLEVQGRVTLAGGQYRVL
ncbi:MAG: MBL fold metallo-hydrolase [Desulfatibacillum sp.]|nr:MBL fold metallo-hydrolase [Desulfatibacillum sp.]